MIKKETKAPLWVVSKGRCELITAATIAVLVSIQVSGAANGDPLEQGQIPFDSQVWKLQNREKMSMMASAIKQKSLIGWKKEEMDQSFDPKWRLEFDGHQLYYFKAPVRAAYALEVVYNDNVVQSYRVVKFDGHSLDWYTDWVK